MIEAGLGGRLDATNVIASSATALTSVALDHTDWLGETVAEIAAEKLAVLEPGTAGDRRAASVRRSTRRPRSTPHASARPTGARASRIRAAVPASLPPYLRRNAAVAIELAATVVPERPER